MDKNMNFTFAIIACHMDDLINGGIDMFKIRILTNDRITSVSNRIVLAQTSLPKSRSEPVCGYA